MKNMKKFFSLLLIISILMIMSINVFCQDTDKFGGSFILSEVEVQKYIPAKAEIPEISTWSATEKQDKRKAEHIDLKDYDVTVNTNWNDPKLSYSITVKGIKDTTNESFTNDLDKIIGEKSITVSWGKLIKKKITFVFDVKQTITQEHEDAVKEQSGIKEVRVIGYEFTKGENTGYKVTFRPSIIKYTITQTSKGITKSKYTDDYKKLLKLMPFKPNSYKAWEKGKWLFINTDWVTPSPSTSSSVEPSALPSIVPDSETSVESIKQNNNSNTKTLPKTGESTDNILIIFGLAIIAIGAIIGIGFKILGNKS